MAGLCAPLSTLRQYPRGHLRMTRGRCGSLLLHRDGLAPSTPCRSPGALRFFPKNRVPAEAEPMAVLSTCIIRTSAVGEIGEEAGPATKDEASARRHALGGPWPHF